MKTTTPEDFPFADLLGLKKRKPQSEAEKLAQTFLDIAKKHPSSRNPKQL